MAASVDMSAAGGPGGGAGGLGELITALARYSAALETIAGSMPDATTGPEANAADTGRETMAAPEAGGGLFASVGEFFKRQAPMATAMVAWLKKKPPATPTPEQSAKPVVEALKEQEAPTAAGAAAGESAEVIIDPALQAAIDANTAAQLGLEEGLAKRQAAEATEAEAMAQALQAPTQAMADALDEARKATAAAAAEYQAAVQAAADADQDLAEAQEAASAKALAQRKTDAKAEHDAAMKAMATPKAKAPGSPGQGLATPAAPGAAPAGGTKAAGGAAGGTIAKAGGAAVGGLASMAGMAMAGPLAFGEMAMGAASQIGKFVGAVNPGIMIALESAFNDLNAVIGTALAPVMQAIVPIIKQMGSALLPVARTIGEAFGRVIEAMQPAIDAITDTFYIAAQTVMPLIDMIAELFITIAPLFEVLGHYIKALYIQLGVFVTVITEIIKSLFGGGSEIKDGIKSLAEGMKSMIDNVLQLFVRGVAYMLKFFGFVNAIGGLANYFKRLTGAKKEDATGIAAAQNAQIKSIESVGKDAAMAAVIASVIPGKGSENKKSEEFYAEMVTELESISGNGENMITTLNSLPDKIGKAIQNALGISMVKNIPKNIGSGIATAYDYTIGAAGRSIGNAAAALVYGVV